MTDTAVLNSVCVECLQILNGDARQTDYLGNSLCGSCVENYYAACTECLRMVVVDEAAIGAGDETVYRRCPECKFASPNQPKWNSCSTRAA